MLNSHSFKTLIYKKIDRLTEPSIISHTSQKPSLQTTDVSGSRVVGLRTGQLIHGCEVLAKVNGAGRSTAIVFAPHHISSHSCITLLSFVIDLGIAQVQFSDFGQFAEGCAHSVRELKPGGNCTWEVTSGSDTTEKEPDPGAIGL